MVRTKGSKNRKSVCLKSNKVYPVRLDMDLQKWVDSQPNKNEYFNTIIRKDFERNKRKKAKEVSLILDEMNKRIEFKEMKGNDMGRMNTYNFVEKGCIFYHVIAESEEQCYSLAEGAGIDVVGMELELERMNVCDELGRPYSPRIEEALIN